MQLIRRLTIKTARIPFGTVVKIDCHQSTYSVICYLFS